MQQNNSIFSSPFWRAALSPFAAADALEFDKPAAAAAAKRKVGAVHRPVQVGGGCGGRTTKRARGQKAYLAHHLFFTPAPTHALSLARSSLRAVLPSFYFSHSQPFPPGPPQPPWADISAALVLLISNKYRLSRSAVTSAITTSVVVVKNSNICIEKTLK